MLNPVSALAYHLEPGQFGSPGDPGVIIEEVVDFSLYQLAAWPESLSAIAKSAAQIVAAPAPPGPGQLINTEKGILMRIEPLKWWLVTACPEEISIEAPDTDEGSFLDLSHSRTWLRVRGDKAITLLNHFMPIDFRPAVFAQNTVVSTAFHHIGVTVSNSDSGFNLFLPRSFAVSLWELLHDSALQYGLKVRSAQSLIHTEDKGPQ